MFHVSRFTFHKKGFTLVEIALVVGILVVLSSIVLVTLNIRGNSAAANNVKRKIDLEQIQKALDLRAQETGDSLPSGLLSGLSERCVGTSSDSFNLNQISWTKNPSDAAITFDVGSCNLPDCSDISWLGQSFSVSPTALTSYNLTNKSYLQYKATFNPPENSWPQDTDADFNGTNPSTTVSGGSVKLGGNIDYGNGSDGDCTISSINTDIKSVYNCQNVTISGTVNITGSQPLTIRATGSVTISGTLAAKGGDGGDVGDSLGGTGIAGGGRGGNSSLTPENGLSGYNRTNGGGQTNRGGGGGGFGAIGGVGGGGAGAGGSSTTVSAAGSGGGGGGSISTASGCSSNYGYGTGGGAGGGLITIESLGSISISGALSANGGRGGDYSVRGNGGGGGSGGGIILKSFGQVVTSGSGKIQANGGRGGNLSVSYLCSARWNYGGGGGGGGRIYIQDVDGASTAVTEMLLGTGGTGYSGLNGSSGSTNSTVNYSQTAYFNSGIYISTTKDTGQASDFTTVSWTSAIPSAATTMIIEMQSANLNSGTDCATGTVDWAGGSGWQSVTTIATANANSSANIPDALDGKRCVQYRATLNTSNTAQTPSLNSITIKYFPGASKPALNDVVISATSLLLGDSRIFTNTTYNDFSFGLINPVGTLAITGSASSNDAAQGAVEYSTGSPPMTYASPIFSGVCYNLTTDLAPLYLGTIPKDPKTGTDENTGYLISVDPATKVVCVKAPGAENDEVIENCRK